MAGINRYDRPAEAQFINTYSPVPFDELLKVGMLKQARIEKGLDQEDALRQSIASMKVAPADEKAYNAKIAEAYKMLDAGGAAGTAEQFAAVRKARNFLVEDPEMRMMANNYPGYAAAVTKLTDAKAKYGTESAAYYKAAKQVNEFNTGAEGLTGTQYLMKKNGVGNFQAEGISTPAAIQPVLYEYLKPVKANMVAGQGLDASGNFMLGSKTTEVTPDKLGSVLGISFKTEVVGGRKVLSVDRTKINYPPDLKNTDAGMYLNIKAEQIADGSNGKITQEEAFKQLYADAASSAINANTSKQSEYTMDESGFALAKYKKLLDTEVPEFSSNVILASESAKFNSKGAVDDGLANIDLKITDAKKEKDAIISDNKIKPQVLPIPGENNVIYVGADGKDYTNQVREKQLEVEDYEGQKTNLEKMLRETKASLRIPDTYAGPTEDLIKDGHVKGTQAEARYLEQLGAPANEDQLRESIRIREETEKAYIEKADPYYKSLNKGLKDNAAKNSFNAKVTRFGNSDLNTAAENHFKTAIQNNAFFNTDGSEVSAEEKRRLSKLSFVSTEKGQENNVFFEGAVWNKDKHMYQFAYSVNDSNVGTSGSKGNLKKSVAKTILVEAPDQAVDILIDKGMTTQAQQVIQQQASMMSEDPNGETKIYFGNPKTDKYAGAARKIKESEKSNYKEDKEYVLEVLIEGPDKVDRITPVAFKDITELGIWYENYRKVAMRKK